MDSVVQKIFFSVSLCCGLDSGAKKVFFRVSVCGLVSDVKKIFFSVSVCCGLDSGVQKVFFSGSVCGLDSGVVSKVLFGRPPSSGIRWRHGPEGGEGEGRRGEKGRAVRSLMTRAVAEGDLLRNAGRRTAASTHTACARLSPSVVSAALSEASAKLGVLPATFPGRGLPRCTVRRAVLLSWRPTL